MAITYITGVPGSGKSYFATYQIWKNFIREPKKCIFKNKEKNFNKYDIVYLNINRFKYDLNPKFEEFHNDDFTAKLVELYNCYVETSGKDDDVLIEKAKDLNLYRALIIIDECHNYLGIKESEVLKWWLTYHRHIYQDIILITQDLSLVAVPYKTIAEHFYQAMPSSVRLFTNSFRYLQYVSYRMYQKDLIDTKGLHIPIVEEVFDLYQSGDKTSNKSQVRKFLYISFVLIFLAFLCFYFFKKSLVSDSPKISSVDIPKESISNVSYSPKISNVNVLVDNNSTKDNYKHTYIFNCFKGFCNLKDEKKFYPVSLIFDVASKNEILYSHYFSTFKGMYVYIYVFKDGVFDFLITDKGVSDEKNSINFINSF